MSGGSGSRRRLTVGPVFDQLEDAFYLPTSLEGTAAARLLGASEQVRRKLTLPGLPIEIALRQSALHMLAASVTENERERETIVGRRWNVEETVAYALGEIASIDTPIQPR
jgi:hypothetical protein